MNDNKLKDEQEEKQVPLFKYFEIKGPYNQNNK
jgi:hypothetical protein